MLYQYNGTKRTYCRCIGVDNNEYIIRRDALVSGSTKSINGACGIKGCVHDIIGQRFGRLVVTEKTNKRGSNGSIIWKCLCDCGNFTYQTSSNLQRLHVKSCGCAKQDFINSQKIDAIGKRYGMLTVIEEVTSNADKRRKMKCLCDCGNTSICSLSDLTTGHIFSCGCFCRSKGEQIIENILKKLGVKYECQKSFEDCKNKKKLRFDFYLNRYNMAFEYDGEQHFKSVEYFGGEKAFKQRVENDKLKNKYCEDNNITLVRFSYKTSEDDILKIITILTNPATITV